MRDGWYLGAKKRRFVFHETKKGAEPLFPFLFKKLDQCITNSLPILFTLSEHLQTEKMSNFILFQMLGIPPAFLIQQTQM